MTNVFAHFRRGLLLLTFLFYFTLVCFPHTHDTGEMGRDNSKFMQTTSPSQPTDSFRLCQMILLWSNSADLCIPCCNATDNSCTIFLFFKLMLFHWSLGNVLLLKVLHLHTVYTTNAVTIKQTFF